MGKYEVNMTNGAAQKLVEELFNKLEIETYGELRDGTPGFILAFQWLNPELKDVVTDIKSAAKFLGRVFTCAGMTNKEVAKAAANFYNFYDDSDLIPDYRDEDGN